jgi:hypothetical protein
MLSLVRRDDAVQDNPQPTNQKILVGLPWARRTSETIESHSHRSPNPDHPQKDSRAGSEWLHWAGRIRHVARGACVGHSATSGPPLPGLCSGRRDGNRQAPPEPHKHRAEQFPIPSTTKPTQRDPWERSMAVTKPALAAQHSPPISGRGPDRHHVSTGLSHGPSPLQPPRALIDASLVLARPPVGYVATCANSGCRALCSFAWAHLAETWLGLLRGARQGQNGWMESMERRETRGTADDMSCFPTTASPSPDSARAGSVGSQPCSSDWRRGRTRGLGRIRLAEPGAPLARPGPSAAP